MSDKPERRDFVVVVPDVVVGESITTTSIQVRHFA